MNIEFKYSFGQEVWFKHDFTGDIFNGYVDKITVHKDGRKIYDLRAAGYASFQEEYIFATKEDVK